MTTAGSNIDPITLEVIYHKLIAITEEQAIALKSISGSPIVTEASDFNNGLYLSDGSILTLGRHALIHSGTMSLMIKNVIKECEENPGIGEGDMFIINNPYMGAAHASDVSIVAPIFYKGERVAWAGSCAHELDVGGMDFGSWCPRATEIQQECVIMPPVRIVEAGRVRRDIWNMILSMSRLPFLMGLDYRAMIAANNVASRRVTNVIERYGLDTVKEAFQSLLDNSESKLRERLRELPNGSFRGVDFLDHDGLENRVYKVMVTITKEDNSISFDFTGSSPQAAGFVNCTESGTMGGVLTSFLPRVAFGIPWNEGIIRAINFNIPKGLICNPVWPAPVGAATCAAAWVVQNATLKGLASLLGCSPRYVTEAQAVSDGSFAVLNLSGLNQYGEPFGTMFLDPDAGGGGAFAWKDGLAAAGPYTGPETNIANVETNESFSPVLYLYRRLLTDSGGPGKYRGGLTAGMAFVLHDVDALQGLLVTHGVESPNSGGAWGGFPGSCNVNTMSYRSNVRDLIAQGRWPTDLSQIKGEVADLGAKPGRISISKDDVFEYTWQGGGGFGDPLDREAQAVIKDVIDGLVSTREARDIYGVAIEGQQVLETETSELRRQKRKDRLGGASVKSVEAPLLKTLHRLGPALLLAEVDGAKVIACRCGFIFGLALANWKNNAAVTVVPDSAAGPVVKLHRDLEMREYICPDCGTLQCVDVALRDDPPLWDLELKG